MHYSDDEFNRADQIIQNYMNFRRNPNLQLIRLETSEESLRLRQITKSTGPS